MLATESACDARNPPSVEASFAISDQPLTASTGGNSRPRRLRLSAVARPTDSAMARSPTLADRRLPANPPPPPAIGNLYPPNAYQMRIEDCYRKGPAKGEIPKKGQASRVSALTTAFITGGQTALPINLIFWRRVHSGHW
jgi:hypothetical protein